MPRQRRLKMSQMAMQVWDLREACRTPQIAGGLLILVAPSIADVSMFPVFDLRACLVVSGDCADNAWPIEPMSSQ